MFFELADGELQAEHLFTYDLYAFGLQFSNAVSLVVDWGHRLTSTSCFFFAAVVFCGLLSK